MAAAVAMLSSLSAWPWSMVASIIGFCTLCMVFYVNFVRPRLRLRKLSYPAHAYFVVPNIERECGYAKQDAEDEHLIKVAVLPTNSEVTVHLAYRPRMAFQTKEVSFGCEVSSGDRKKPVPFEYDNPFVQEGRRRIVPGPETADYLDIFGQYHSSQDKTWSVGTDRSYAFKVRTYGPGVYRACTAFVGDDKEGRAYLTIRVEEHPHTKMRCVIRKHRGKPCSRGIAPKDRE